jgi:hypothetical protein
MNQHDHAAGLSCFLETSGQAPLSGSDMEGNALCVDEKLEPAAGARAATPLCSGWRLHLPPHPLDAANREEIALLQPFGHAKRHRTQIGSPIPDMLAMRRIRS